jgi:hypothetical protein
LIVREGTFPPAQIAGNAEVEGAELEIVLSVVLDEPIIKLELLEVMRVVEGVAVVGPVLSWKIESHPVLTAPTFVVLLYQPAAKNLLRVAEIQPTRMEQLSASCSTDCTPTAPAMSPCANSVLMHTPYSLPLLAVMIRSGVLPPGQRLD